MVDTFLLYISAASDLDLERDLLARAVTEIPVTLRWRIIQSTTRGESQELEAAGKADLHFLIMGSDIRAPIGLEWYIAQRDSRTPILFLKQDATHTPAAGVFIRELGSVETWRPFKSSSDLRQQFLKLIGDHLLNQAAYYELNSEEYERLVSWRKEIDKSGMESTDEVKAGAGESSIILSRERYMPSEGVLIKPPREHIEGEESK